MRFNFHVPLLPVAVPYLIQCIYRNQPTGSSEANVVPFQYEILTIVELENNAKKRDISMYGQPMLFCEQLNQNFHNQLESTC